MAVWAVIQDLSDILLVQRSRKTTRAGQWYFPGGGIKVGETPEQACIREVEEETRLSIGIADGAIRIGDDYYFCCKLNGRRESIELKMDECSQYAWIQPANLTNIGIVMNLKIIVPLLRSMGYEIDLSDDLERYIS